MIKKWNNFIKESVDIDIDEIIKTIEDTDDIQIDYFLNKIISKGFNHVLFYLFKYSNSLSEESKEVVKGLRNILGPGIEYIISWVNNDYSLASISRLRQVIKEGKSLDEVKKTLLELLDLYKRAKSNDNSKVSFKERAEEVVKLSIDEDVLSVDSVYETYQYLIIKLYFPEELNIKEFEKISDELSVLESRIYDETGLKNHSIEFSNEEEEEKKLIFLYFN